MSLPGRIVEVNGVRLHVSEQGKSTRWQAGADHDDRVAGLRRWAELVHRQGATFVKLLEMRLKRAGITGEGAGDYTR